MEPDTLRPEAVEGHAHLVLALVLAASEARGFPFVDPGAERFPELRLLRACGAWPALHAVECPAPPVHQRERPCPDANVTRLPDGDVRSPDPPRNEPVDAADGDLEIAVLPDRAARFGISVRSART